MKNHALLLIALFAFTGADLSAREFTDPQGRKLEAEITAAGGGQVTMKRASDGVVFTVPVTTFSPADQKYINQWALENQSYSFDVRYDKTKGETTKQKLSDELRTTEMWSYKIELRNKLPSEVSNLRVDYWLFKKEDQGRGKGAARVATSGSHKIESLKGSASHSFETLPIALHKSQLVGNVIYVDGTRARFADAMGGVVVRVFDPKNREVYCYASDEDLKPAAVGRTRGSTSKAGK
ncbi:MAG: hypothetical protein R3F13_06830 [Prosthecobacter sp.]